MTSIHPTSSLAPRPGCQKSCHVIPSPVTITGLDSDCIDLSTFRLQGENAFPALASSLHKLFSFAGTAPAVLELRRREHASRTDESYRLSITAQGGILEAGTDRATQYALETIRQIRIGTYLPQVHVEDSPALSIRGFHTNLASQRQFQAQDVRALLRQMAKFKLNTYLLEYNERFPFQSHPGLAGANAFTSAEVAEFQQQCQRDHLEIIPLLQCIGHNGPISRHPDYAHLFEPRDDGQPSEQLCPLNPQSFTLFTELATEIMSAHPGGRYLHIGADEARSLGACPQCAEFARRHGPGRLYVEYINQIAEWVLAQGRTPIIWDDMLSRYPELIPAVNPALVIMYWDYWTTRQPSPIFVARAAGRGIVADQSWRDCDYAGLEEPEQTITRKFARAMDVQELMNSSPAAQNFVRYLGPGYPRHFTAFPYFDFYREHGFQVIGAPTTLGNTMDDSFGLPNFARFRANIREFSRKCQLGGALGMITSSWYNFPPEILSLGVLDTGQHTWQKLQSDHQP